MRLIVFLLALLFAAHALADAPGQYPQDPSNNGTYELGVQVPNTRDGGKWAMTVNVYAAKGALGNIVVMFPGATGNADTVCQQFHECFAAPVTSASQVNWLSLNPRNTVLITVNTAYARSGLDQCNAAHVVGGISHFVLTVSAAGSSYFNVAAGQTVVIAGVSTGLIVQPFGTNGTTGTGTTGTYYLSADGGTVAGGTTMFLEAQGPSYNKTTTSCNFSETDGQDTLEFVNEVADWAANGCTDQTNVKLCDSATLLATVGLPNRHYLVGFSNGGMLVDRVWCQNPAHYAAFAVVSGPEPTLLDQHGCTSPTPKPYLAFFGALDPDLGICTGCTSQADNNWSASSWSSQNPTLAALEPGGISTYVPAPKYFCEFSRQYGGSPACTGNGASIPAYGSGGFASVATHTAVSGTAGAGFDDVYCYGGANCPMKLHYIYKGGHSPLDDYAALGYFPIKEIFNFFAANT